jgi:hypothetical protein
MMLKNVISLPLGVEVDCVGTGVKVIRRFRVVAVVVGLGEDRLCSEEIGVSSNRGELGVTLEGV